MTPSRKNTTEYTVDYKLLDQFKREALAQAAQSVCALTERLGFRFIPESRGESVALVDCGSMIIAFVLEGIGTKGEVAREIYEETGKMNMDHIAWDNVATNLNDLAVCGAEPLMFNSFIATGSPPRWFTPDVLKNYNAGIAESLQYSGSFWGGGETQELKGVVYPHSAVLAGAAVGIICPKERRIKGNIENGDTILVIASNGINANGLTLARDIAGALQNGYQTKLPNGRTYGEELLQVTHIYAPVIRELLNAGIPIRYITPITGHGWRKVMRHPGEFTYRIKQLPPLSHIFRFIQEQAGASDRKMLETFNCGGDIAFILPPEAEPKASDIIKTFGFMPMDVGTVHVGERSVIIEPLGEEGIFRSEEYSVR